MKINDCYFCGKEMDEDSFHFRGDGPPPSYQVECQYCGARGSSGLGSGREDYEGAKSSAIRFWNSVDHNIRIKIVKEIIDVDVFK